MNIYTYVHKYVYMYVVGICFTLSTLLAKRRSITELTPFN